MAAVLVHIDLDGDRPHPASIVALAAGRHVASSWGATLYAAVIVQRRAGDSPQQLAAEARVPGIEQIETDLARGGADKIVVAFADGPVVPLWACTGAAWEVVLDRVRPRLVLFGADAPSAPELGPRTAARIGARLLARARAIGIDDVELRDRDGGYARQGDSGAAVALIGRADAAPLADDDIDLLVIATPGGADPRIELASASGAEAALATGTIVAIGDDVAGDAQVGAQARRLAGLLGAQLVGGAAAARAGLVPAGAIVDRTTPLAPELLVAIGAAQLDLAGAAALVKIGSQGGKNVDGALPQTAGLGDLLKRLAATTEGRTPDDDPTA